MGNKNLLFYCTPLTFGSLMLMTTTSNGVLSTFLKSLQPITAIVHLPIEGPDLGGSSQDNNCVNLSICDNVGASSIQDNNCNGSICINRGDSNTQQNGCRVSICQNEGQSGTQNDACQGSICINSR